MSQIMYAHTIYDDGDETIFITDTDDVVIASARYNESRGRDADHTLPEVVSAHKVEVYTE